MPAAIGLGVNTGRRAAERRHMGIARIGTAAPAPGSRGAPAASRKVARQAIWWLRRIATAPMPKRFAPCPVAASTASFVVQMPGSRRASQVSTAPSSRRYLGAARTSPCAPVPDLLDIVGQQCEAMRVVAEEIGLDEALGHGPRRLRAAGLPSAAPPSRTPCRASRIVSSAVLGHGRAGAARYARESSAARRASRRRTAPGRAAVRRKMPAKARSGRMLPVTIWM